MFYHQAPEALFFRGMMTRLKAFLELPGVCGGGKVMRLVPTLKSHVSYSRKIPRLIDSYKQSEIDR